MLTEQSINNTPRLYLETLLATNTSNLIEHLRSVYTIFSQIKHQPFEEKADEFRLCAKIAARCLEIEMPWQFEYIYEIQSYYLEKNNTDREILEAFVWTRDRYLQQSSSQAQFTLWTVSNVLDEDVKETEDLNPSTESDSLPLKPLFFNKKITALPSLETLQGSFNLLKQNMSQTKKNLEADIVKLIGKAISYVYVLKKEYPLEQERSDIENTALMNRFEYVVNIYSTIIQYLKTQSVSQFSLLNKVFRHYAFLSRIFADYYNKTSENETKKLATRINVIDAEMAALNLKGIIACEHILNSSMTSTEEKERAQQLKEKQLQKYHHIQEDHLNAARLHEALRANNYHFFAEEFERLKYWFPLFSFGPLYGYVTQYLEYTLFQWTSLNLTIFHVEDASVEVEIDLSRALISHDFSTERASFLKVFNLYYAVKSEYVREMLFTYRSDPNQQSFLTRQAFEDSIRIESYHYLLSPPEEHTFEQKLLQYDIISKQIEFSSPLIKALVAYEKECVEAAMREAAAKTTVLTCSVEAPDDVKKNKPSHLIKKANKKKEKKLQKKANRDSEAWNEIRQHHRRPLPFSKQWRVYRCKIMHDLKEKNAIQAFLHFDQPHLEQFSLNAEETYDMYLLKSACLTLKGEYVLAIEALDAARNYITSSENRCLYYTQKEKELLARLDLLVLMNNHSDASDIRRTLKELSTEYNTPCFALLWAQLMACPETMWMIAINQYPTLMLQLKNKETNFLLNEYNFDAFLAFYQALSKGYFDKGQYLLDHNTGLSPERYFDDSTDLLTFLIYYAEAYGLCDVFLLKKELLTRYKDIDLLFWYNQKYNKAGDALFESMLNQYKDIPDHAASLEDIRTRLKIGQNKKGDYMNSYVERCVQQQSLLTTRTEHLFRTSNFSGHHETIVQLKNNIWQTLENQMFFDQVRSLTQLLCFKMRDDDPAGYASKEKDRQAFFDRMDVVDAQLLAGFQCDREQLQKKRVEATYAQRAVLLDVYEVECSYLHRLYEMRNEQRTAHQIGVPWMVLRAQDLNIVIPVQEAFVAQTAAELMSNEVVQNVEDIELRKIVTDIHTMIQLSDEEKNCLWVRFLIALIKEKSKTAQADEFLCAAQILHWFLVKLKEKCFPMIEQQQQWNGLKNIFDNAKAVCISYYNKSKRNECSKDKKAVVGLSLPSFQLLSEESSELKSPSLRG